MYCLKKKSRTFFLSETKKAAQKFFHELKAKQLIFKPVQKSSNFFSSNLFLCLKNVYYHNTPFEQQYSISSIGKKG